MRYLYLFLEIIVYVLTAAAYWAVFSKYRYIPAFEHRLDTIRKTSRRSLALFLGVFGVAVAAIIITWRSLYPAQPHHIGYFLAFFTGTVVMLAWFRNQLKFIDIRLCIPAMITVWALLLAFEAILLFNDAGWIYTDSTVLSIKVGAKVEFILENLIFFYLFSPFVSIVMFSALAQRRSDISAFFLTALIIWSSGVFWECVCIGMFNLWYMIEDRSVCAFTLFGARTTIEEMLYYVPFSSLAVLIYLFLYYRKYRFPLVGD